MWLLRAGKRRARDNAGQNCLHQLKAHMSSCREAQQVWGFGVFGSPQTCFVIVGSRRGRGPSCSLSLHIAQVPSSPQYFPAGMGSPHSGEIFGRFGIRALSLQLEPEQNLAFPLCQQHSIPRHMWGPLESPGPEIQAPVSIPLCQLCFSQGNTLKQWDRHTGKISHRCPR